MSILKQRLLYKWVCFITFCLYAVCLPAMAVEVDSEIFPGLSEGVVKKKILKKQLVDPAWKQKNTAVVRLPAPGKDQLKAVLEKENMSMRQQIGFSRTVEQLNTKKKTADLLSWRSLSGGGYVGTLILASTEAVAIRLGLEIVQLPERAELRFFIPSSQVKSADIEVVSGEHILTLMAMKMESGVDDKTARRYWSPTIEGDAIGLEIYLPAGVNPAEVQVASSMLSHLYRSPFNDLNRSGEDPPPTYCGNDAACYSEWSSGRNATAKMVFTEGEYTYNCTGVLLNDRDRSTYVPYFITANHCIGDESVAATLETLWFYESSTCDSDILNPNYSYRSGGAELLWTKGRDETEPLIPTDITNNQDFTLLKLLDSPPRGAVFAGWSEERTPDTILTGIHHPRGALKKLTFSYLEAFSDCFEAGEGFYCNDDLDDANFIYVLMTKGGMEPGSSGSGIFNSAGRVLGVLYGGTSLYCKGGGAYYSNFKSAYTTGDLGQWLYDVPPTGGDTTPDDETPDEVTLDSVEISGPVTVDENTSASFTATATYSDGTTQDVTTTATWSDNSTDGTVGSGGYFFASLVSVDTPVEITATYDGETGTHDLVIINTFVAIPGVYLLL